MYKICFLTRSQSILRHLTNIQTVELFNISNHAHLRLLHKSDSNTRAAKAPAPTNAVDVVLARRRHIVVEHKRNLLHIDTTRPQVGGDEDAGFAIAEVSHDVVALALLHVTMHCRDGVVVRRELAREPLDLLAGVAEDDCVRDHHGVVEVAERVVLPLLLLDRDEELLDAVRGDLIAGDENADGVGHELLRDLEDLAGHGGRDEHDLALGREHAEDVVDLLAEPAREHLVRLVEDKALDVAGEELALANHVEDAAGGARDDVHAVVEAAGVLEDRLAADAGVGRAAHVGAHELALGLRLQREFAVGAKNEHLGVARVAVGHLERAHGEGGGLAGAGGGLGDDVAAVDDGDDEALLDRGGVVVVGGVDALEELAGKAHGLEGLEDGDLRGLVVVGREAVGIGGTSVVVAVVVIVLIRHFF